MQNIKYPEMNLISSQISHKKTYKVNKNDLTKRDSLNKLNHNKMYTNLLYAHA